MATVQAILNGMRELATDSVTIVVIRGAVQGGVITETEADQLAKTNGVYWRAE